MVRNDLKPIRSLKQPNKKMRGRPKNSLSFASVSLAELNAKFNPDQMITIGRIWYEKVTKTPASAAPISVSVETLEDGPKVEMTLTP